MNVTQYFDLQTVWVNELIGDVMLFFIAGLVVIWLVVIKTKIPYPVATLLSLVWVGVMYSIYQDLILIFWAFMVLLVAAAFYYNISKAIARGG